MTSAPVRLYPWLCGICDGSGLWSSGERCLECAGYGHTEKPHPMGESERPEPAPRPPAVMRSPCADCAFRPGSPEQEHDDELKCLRDKGKPFYCHQGMPMVNGQYAPVATIGDVPLGYKLCSGWWDWATGDQLPSMPYRQIDHR